MVHAPVYTVIYKTLTFIYSAKLCTNINLKVWNQLHGPMHYKIGVTCVFNGHDNLFLFEKPEIEFVVNWTHLA